MALNEGLRCKKRLWRDARREQLEAFELARWASRRRRDLLELLDRLTPMIAELKHSHRTGSRKMSGGAAFANASRATDGVGLRADHRASGAVSVWQADRMLSGTGAVGRFQWTAATLGHITKQGNSLLRFLLVEAAQVTVRSLPEWRRKVLSPSAATRTENRQVAMAEN